MEPFLFNSGGTELYAAYHAPPDPSSRSGLVICSPYPAEQNRVFDTLRQVAQHWASSGYHVLRFDYLACGDSFGAWESAGPDVWAKNIEDAVNELSEVAGVRNVTLLAPRFGAILAVQAAAACEVDSLVLWDPLLSGREQLRDLETMHRQLVSTHTRLSSQELKDSQKELCGQEIVSWMDEQLPNTRMPGELPDRVKRVTIVTSTGGDTPVELEESWAGSGADTSVFAVEHDCLWDSDPGLILSAAPIVEALKPCK